MNSDNTTMNDNVPKHIAVLDGVRALSIVMVVWFHFWQQNWLTPYISLPAFIIKYTGIKEFNLAGFVACGYIFVDLIILLSAICNFYPYARSIYLGEPWPDTKTFYKKRIIRIMPSYIFAVVTMILIEVAGQKYDSVAAIIEDLFVNLLCLKTFSNKWMMFSKTSGVLWTVQIEVLYYILMPWLAKLFRKNMYAFCGILWGISIISLGIFGSVSDDSIRYLNNNILTYAGLYANGFLLCALYIRSKQIKISDDYKKVINIVSIVTIMFCFWLLNGMVHELRATSQIQRLQMSFRIPMGLIFSIMIYAFIEAGEKVERFMSNALFKFICLISYNLYIWHQYIAVKLKEYHIPFYEGDQPPNMLGDKIWSIKYTIICITTSVVVAVLATYMFEMPFKKKKVK